MKEGFRYYGGVFKGVWRANTKHPFKLLTSICQSALSQIFLIDRAKSDELLGNIITHNLR